MPIPKEAIQPPTGEASINHLIISVLEEFPGLDSVDFSGLPNIAKLFEVVSPANIEVGDPHENLFTSGNLYQGDDPRISGVWYQRIGNPNSEIDSENGTISEHDHSATNEHEILIFYNDPGYANIPTEAELNKNVSGLQMVFIPAGTRHGNNAKDSSYGDWVSIKVKAN